MTLSSRVWRALLDDSRRAGARQVDGLAVGHLLGDDALRVAHVLWLLAAVAVGIAVAAVALGIF